MVPRRGVGMWNFGTVWRALLLSSRVERIKNKELKMKDEGR
jgi:hypothetical protein